MAEQEDIYEDSHFVEFAFERKLCKEKFLELKKFHGKTMGRSLKKGPYIDEKLLKKVLKQKEAGDRLVIKTWARSSQIAPEFVGHKIAVHNGRKHIELLISEGMIGHRLGEFAPTRTFRTHGKVTKRVTEKT